jgi:hypothetical protein
MALGIQTTQSILSFLQRVSFANIPLACRPQILVTINVVPPLSAVPQNLGVEPQQILLRLSQPLGAKADGSPASF